MRALYQAFYRFNAAPWGRTPSPDLVALVENGRIAPCRAIDIGCGTGITSIYLASRGFDVTGIDYSSMAIWRATQAAERAGVTAAFIGGDITSPADLPTGFDLLVDHGTFDDLTVADRAHYVSSADHIASATATFYLWCFEWEPSQWERLLTKVLPLGNVSVEPGEIDRWFSPQWSIEPLAITELGPAWPRRAASYLMHKAS